MQGLKKRAHHLSLLQKMNHAQRQQSILMLNDKKQKSEQLKSLIECERQNLQQLFINMDSGLEAGSIVDVHRQQRFESYVQGKQNQIQQLQVQVSQVESEMEAIQVDLVGFRVDEKRISNLSERNDKALFMLRQKRDEQQSDELNIGRRKEWT